jgi:hypothetical protein
MEEGQVPGDHLFEALQFQQERDDPSEHANEADEEFFNVSRIVRPARQVQPQQHAQIDLDLHEQLMRVAISAAVDALGETTVPRPDKKKRKGTPSNPLWRVWKTFREDFIRLENLVRKGYVDQRNGEEVLGIGNGHVTKKSIADLAGVVPKGITRYQVWHRLDPDIWPPSTWPEKAPRARRLKRFVRDTASLAAGLGLGWGLVHWLSDGYKLAYQLLGSPLA